MVAACLVEPEWGWKSHLGQDYVLLCELIYVSKNNDIRVDMMAATNIH